jgi:hypothetical protein
MVTDYSIVKESPMRISQVVLNTLATRKTDFDALSALKPDWVIAFGSVDMLQASSAVLAEAFPHATRSGCSTAGEISDAGVSDHSLVVTAVSFNNASTQQVSTPLESMDDSYAAGCRLGHSLKAEGLRAVVLFGQGVQINGSALIAGVTSVVGMQIPVTGGLAGDGGAFVKTCVLDQDGVSSNRLACIGLYGESLVLSHGSLGGWSPFGPARRVTRCENNILYELDGQPALEVYKKYLGEHAKDLPASGLLFPFAMLGEDHSELGLTRTILGVDEASGSLTLAGDIVQDGYLKLMHSNTDALVDAAETAAHASLEGQNKSAVGLALLVSCVGRKLVMGGRVDEEVEVVGDAFGEKTTIAGFYSYGEISPYSRETACKLLNQTMTISYVSEA